MSNPVHTYTVPGIYSVKLVACNATGDCDSLLKTAYINIIPEQFVRSASICPGQSYVVSTHTYYTSGTYVDSLTTTSGCDSIITTNLTVTPGPAIAVTPDSYCRGDSMILSATAGINSYQWYKNNLMIPLATNQLYVAKERGYFWCMGYNSSLCATASNAYHVIMPCLVEIPGSGYGKNGTIENVVDEDIFIFPNPSSGLFAIQSPGGQLEIYSYTGALILSKQIDAGAKQIDLSRFADGFYLVKLQTHNSNVLKSVVLLRH
jgi:PKD repeat protein